MIILGCDLVIEILANFFVAALHLRTNSPLYNVAMLIEFWGYALYYRFIIEKPAFKRIITWYLYLFPVFWVLLVFPIFKVDNWNSYIAVFGCICVILFSSVLYYQLFTAEKLVRLAYSFEFWVATALILFYSVNFTYLGMLH